VGSYYPEGLNPVRILIENSDVRAVRGGTGFTKCGGNYAASILAGDMAKHKGYAQVLWLDGVEQRYVEEVGTSNIFFLIKNELITPSLTGSILPGVTRDTVLQLAKHWGVTCSERPITIDEVIDTAKSGDLKEMFDTGTAAVISPVGSISYKEESFTISDGNVGELSRRLYDEIIGIQYGEKEDTFGWVRKLDV
ncbi:MAG: aminotransferase class IV, partial [Syntrophobacteraceae bacterium]